ncbi:MAG: cobalt-zinc-cadmium efflux system outer membrane protein [Sulfurimonas sp.]|uniref:TolC family protein n=1 Tax=Sulfurimonas sp. TaxID=2022749 RepID=UPI0039E341C8
MKFFVLLLLPIWLLAVSLETLIQNAKNNHQSLKTIEQRVSAIDDSIDISQNFADPLVSLSVNDIQFNDIVDRRREPMQSTALSLQQRIPYFGKRDAKKKKLRAQKEVAELSIDEMKVKLVKAIKITAYSIWQIEEELKIIEEYFTLTKRNISLSSGYASSDSKSHMSIMSAEMTLSELRIKQSRLHGLLNGFYKKLSYLSAMEVKKLELSLEIQPHKHIDIFSNEKHQNISYKSKVASLKVAQEEIKVRELDKYSDPILKAGYFYREKFNDYASISVAFSLPLYGTQDLQIQKSKKLALANKSDIADFNSLLESQLSEIHSKIEDSFRVYDIIHNQSMPQIEHMFELSSSSIKNGDELFIYINLLERKLSLDEKSIAVVAAYNKYLAQLEALVGEMK